MPARRSGAAASSPWPTTAARVSRSRPISTKHPEPPPWRLARLRTVVERLEVALAASVADSTDLVWIESASARMAGSRAPVEVRRGSSLEARAAVAGRLGTFHATDGSTSELEHAVRQALAVARGASPSPAPSARLDGDVGPLTNRDLFDRRISRLSPDAARKILVEAESDGLEARLSWSEAQVAIVTDRGPTRRASVTSIALAVSAGEPPATAFARGVARSLDRIDPAALVERAHQKLRDVSGAGELPDALRPIVLSPEAAADLLGLFGDTVLGAAAWSADASPSLAEHLGQPWLSSRIRIDDDGHELEGLPFPFDFAGNPKRAVRLVEGGVLITPAVGPILAAELSLAPTPHFEAPGECRPRHLFLRPSGTHDADPLGTAPDGAIWIDRLARPRLALPGTFRFRAGAYDLREIHGGRLGASLPAAIWEDDLERVFKSIAATGAKAALSPSRDGPWGAASSPALGIATGGTLREMA